jgi:hypothetical protein
MDEPPRSHDARIPAQGAGGAQGLREAVRALGGAQLERTLRALAAGLPVFEATFGDGDVVIADRGSIPPQG